MPLIAGLLPTRIGHAGLALLMLAAVAGCTAGETSRTRSDEAEALLAARDRLDAALRSCSERYPYDPNDPSLPERALGPNELEWRQCAYEAAREYSAVNTSLALDFATLIDEDQKLTQALAAGEITRSERRSRLQPLITAVHEKELEQIEELEADRARQDALVRRITEGLR